MIEATIDARAPLWPRESKQAAGVVYVATSRRYVDEAGEAAMLLRRTNPHIPVCLVTDEPHGPAFWDELVTVRAPAFGFRDKILMGLCPFERFLYLDTDTTVIDDISDVFELLKRFDFVGHQLFEGHDCPLPGIPDAFPEFNGGVLGFRRSPALGDFFARWLARYDAYYALNRDGDYHYSNSSDQKSLRETLYESNIRIAVLGPEYNLTPHHLVFSCAQVRILHGRGRQNLAGLQRRFNAKLGNRVYVPRLDAVIHDDMLAPELRHLWWMVTLQIIRKAGRRLTPLKLRDWLRRSALVRRLFLRNRFTETTAANDPKWHEPGPPAA
jgi:hypothetical protein